MSKELRLISFGVPKKIRFARPFDHHATRPGFQAPWGSHDPHAKISLTYVFTMSAVWIGVSCVASWVIDKTLLKPSPNFSTTKEWVDATNERKRKLDGGN